MVLLGDSKFSVISEKVRVYVVAVSFSLRHGIEIQERPAAVFLFTLDLKLKGTYVDLLAHSVRFSS